MRLRANRHFHAALVALLLPGSLAADETVTRAKPVPLVPFRSAPSGRDVNLRDAAPAPQAAPATPIARKNLPRPLFAPATVSPKVASLVPYFPKPEPPQRRPDPPAVTRIVPPQPTPRSPLSPRNEPPVSALPPGGRDLALQPTTFTPYDRYLGSVRSVIVNLEPREVTMAGVARLMKEGHHFRYCVCDPYRADPPALTEARHAGDCKSKALWLYDSLGDTNALFVIGKAEQRSRTSHAWVYWRSEERWWILDCTERTDPIAADSVSSDRYVPYYSFGKGGAYRHKATRLILTGALSPDIAPVAARR